jgi:hypothetical protein
MTGAPGVRSLAATVVAAGVLVASAATLQSMREARYPVAVANEDSLYVTSGTMVRRLSVGFDALAADLYWIRAIQYYGGTKLTLASAGGPGAPAVNADGAIHAYPLLHPLLDLTTTLDPKFNIAYRFGAIFLAEPYPGGAGRPDLAIALLEKGLKASADKWEYMQDVGFVHYWWRQDYKAASEWFDRASRVRGAPWWLRSLAANTLTEGGDRRSSRLMWEAIRESAEIDWLRTDAERRLTQLQALDQIDTLQRTLDQAAARGLAPNWTALTRARILPGVPVDPSGTPYELSATGRVQLSPKSTLYPPPREPQQLGPPS